MNIGIYEARKRFSELIKRVAEGERITITRRGIPVACMTEPQPAKRHDRKRIRKAIAELREFRRGTRLDGLSIRKMIEEGRE